MAGSVISLLALALSVSGYPTNTGVAHPGLTIALARQSRTLPHEAIYLHKETDEESDEVRHTAREPVNTTAAQDSDPQTEEQVANSQHFFPSFSPIFPPLGHSRPPFFQEQAYNTRPAYKPHDSFGFGSGSFRDYSFAHAPAQNDRSANMLGSGNFGVLRGGTYYPGENDESLNDDLYNNYYNNGHGRPSFYPANPLPSFRQGGDFFANFKDFADISTPTKSSYSEYFVVYVNPNSTSTSEFHPDTKPVASAPKNIFEQLQILDATPNSDVPETKLSKAKLKLKRYKEHHQTKEVLKKQKTRPSPKELYEPLLALS